MVVISFLNYKGGVGKTTATLNLAKGLVNQGKEVLILDLDGQANSTSHLLGEPVNYGIPNLLLNPTTESVNQAIKQTDSGIDLIGSNFTMQHAVSEVKMNATIPQHVILRNIINKIDKDYDYVIMDCPPALDMMSVNVILQSNLIIVPVTADSMSLEGLSKTISFINDTADNFEIAANYRLLHSRKNRNSIDNQFIEEIKRNNLDSYLTTIRYQAQPVNDCSLNRKFVIDESNKGVGEDYQEFVNEFLRRGV